MELPSPTSQMDGNASSRPTTPPAGIEPVPNTTADNINNKSPVENSERGSAIANDNSEKVTAAPYEQSEFVPMAGGEKSNSAPSSKNDPADEIVVGTRGRNATAKTSQTVDDNSKVPTSDTVVDDGPPATRVSKRKRTSRYSKDPEVEEYLDALNDEEETEARSFPTKGKSKARKVNAPEAEASPLQEPTTAASGSKVVPLDAPIRPARRGLNSNTTTPAKKTPRSATKTVNYAATSSSDSELSETLMSPINMYNSKPSATSALEKVPEPDVGAVGAAVKSEPAHGQYPVTVGYWKGSSEPDPADKHCIIGVLGTNNQLRVRLVKRTRDGRYLEGNHPSGAGSVWRGWDEIEYEPHIRHLTRAQLKEYVRVRRSHKEKGEQPEAVARNEEEAVKVAEAVAPGEGGAVSEFVKPAETFPAELAKAKPLKRKASVALKDSSRVAKKRTPTVDQVNDRALLELSRKDAARQRRRSSQHAASTVGATPSRRTPDREPSVSGDEASGIDNVPVSNNSGGAGLQQRTFRDRALEGLQQNWVAQSEAAARDGRDEAQVYLNKRYELKRAGPFAGMYAAPSTVIAIDGREFVETRVLREI